jgi:hypothetical protein
VALSQSARLDAGFGRPVDLADAAHLAALCSSNPFQPSEHLFANLWLFRERHRYRLHEGPVPHLRGVTYDGIVHALPLGRLDRAAATALFADGVQCLFPYGSDGPGEGERLGLQATCLDADSDYWFESAALARLAGAKQRRSQVALYGRQQAPVFESWQATAKEEALAVLEGWAADVGRSPGQTDLSECREAIALAEILQLEGGLVRTAAGECVAFLLASRSGDTRVVHFAKGRRAHSAAYPFMFSSYAAQCGAAWVNFEQDLGNAGLAQSKRAYAPHHRQPKWRLVPQCP